MKSTFKDEFATFQDKWKIIRKQLIPLILSEEPPILNLEYTQTFDPTKPIRATVTIEFFEMKTRNVRL